MTNSVILTGTVERILHPLGPKRGTREIAFLKVGRDLPVPVVAFGANVGRLRVGDTITIKGELRSGPEGRIEVGISLITAPEPDAVPLTPDFAAAADRQGTTRLLGGKREVQ